LPTPNLAPARQELAKLNAGDAAHLAVAIQDKRIVDAKVEEVKEVLRYAMMKLGLRGQNLPSEIEKMLIIQHVFQTYPGHGLEEFKLAFDMAIARKLPVDPNCYENFSCEYISRIMAAYRKWAAQEYKELPTAPPPAAQVTEDISEEAMQKWLLEEIDFIKTGKPLEFVPEALYDYAVKSGKMQPSPEAKFAALEKAAAYREGQLMREVEAKTTIDNLQALEHFRAMRKNGCIKGKEIDRVKSLAKKLLFFEHAQRTA